MSFTEKVKALFNTEVEVVVETETTEANKFLDIPVGDKIFRVDSEVLAEGDYIFEVVTEEVDGEVIENIVKVEDGDYTLEDGKTIKVENDTVTSITEEAEKEEETTEEEEEVVEDFKEEKVNEFESVVFQSFTRMKEDFKLLVEINEELKNEITKLKEDFTSKIEEIKKLPGGQSVSLKKQGFKFEQKNNSEEIDRLQNLSKYRK
mgnify:CR=1 FL=1